MRTGSQWTLVLPPSPLPDRGLWLSEHIWLLSPICDTAAPLDRAQSKRQLPQGHTRAIWTGVFWATVFPHPSHSQGQAEPRDAQQTVPGGGSPTPDGAWKELQGVRGSVNACTGHLGTLRPESKDLPTATEHATDTRLQGSWLPFLGCLPPQVGTLGKKKRSKGLEWRFPTSEEEIHPHPPWSKEERELWSQTDAQRS